MSRLAPKPGRTCTRRSTSRPAPRKRVAREQAAWMHHRSWTTFCAFQSWDHPPGTEQEARNITRIWEGYSPAWALSSAKFACAGASRVPTDILLITPAHVATAALGCPPERSSAARGGGGCPYVSFFAA